MYPFGRLLWTFLAARRRPPLEILETSWLDGRIWPQDLDFYAHLNNGRYLTLMDLGRIDLLQRQGFVPLIQRGWLPLVANIQIRFRRELRFGDQYRLETRVQGWDERWFFLEQSFWVGSRRMSLAHLQLIFKHGSETIPPSEVVAALGSPCPSPALPASVIAWLEAQEKLSEELAGEARTDTRTKRSG